MIDKTTAARVRATLRRIVTTKVKAINQGTTVAEIMVHWPNEDREQLQAYVETCLDFLEAELLARVHNFIV